MSMSCVTLLLIRMMIGVLEKQRKELSIRLKNVKKLCLLIFSALLGSLLFAVIEEIAPPIREDPWGGASCSWGRSYAINVEKLDTSHQVVPPNTELQHLEPDLVVVEHWDQSPHPLLSSSRSNNNNNNNNNSVWTQACNNSNQQIESDSDDKLIQFEEME
ncbi:uncharacterized protein LOC132745587 [Ruditapes philippinarum]|uniref:uncharacterized protein LOC132745587 n=1 Tax=Ruditapes philippinarum TaxID=129788 RepID=UPI00295B73C0|nr:uncharacterized protein LOC132745587 [Ruditapes philippinarum]